MPPLQKVDFPALIVLAEDATEITFVSEGQGGSAVPMHAQGYLSELGCVRWSHLYRERYSPA